MQRRGDPGWLAEPAASVLTKAAVVLDWFHIAMRFQHALQTAAGLGTGTVPANDPIPFSLAA